MSEADASGERTGRTVERGWRTNRWIAGAASGVVAGIAFGVMLQMNGTMTTIGALVGVETVVVGWVVHLVISLVFGLVFAALLAQESLARATRTVPASAALGILYGVVLWIVAAGVVMPLWLDAMGVTALPVPNLDPTSLLGHAVYGVVLGALVPLIRGGPERFGVGEETVT